MLRQAVTQHARCWVAYGSVWNVMHGPKSCEALNRSERRFLTVSPPGLTFTVHSAARFD